MDTTILDLIRIAGAPTSVAVGGYLLYRYFSFRFGALEDHYKEIRAALNKKVDGDVYKIHCEDTEYRVRRLEAASNGKVAVSD